MKDCIIKCVDNINNNYYGENCVDITGPLLLYKISSKYNEKYKCEYIYLNHYNLLQLRHNSYIKFKNKKICNTCYYNYYTKYIDTNYYMYKWYFKKIYNK
jgi:hypothetical protein